MMKSEIFTNRKIHVIIATAFQRTDLLLERSLRSVYNQEDIDPQHINILIIDDNDSSVGENSCEYKKITCGVCDLRSQLQLSEDYFPTTVLPNKRTKGNSGTGAWNTGIYYSYNKDESGYISLLDDDDQYLPSHLADCLQMANNNPKAVGIFQKMHWQNEDGSIMTLPLCLELLTPKQFFIGNPGVQGSNMFFKTSSLIAIQGFNEAYPNTTDRELMIRFLWYVNQHKNSQEMLAVIEKLGVIHYNHSQAKVNNNLELKQIGLDLFYREYREYFSKEDYQKSITRAQKFFKYKPTVEK